MTSAPVAPEQRNLVRERIRQAFVAKEKAADRAYAEGTEAQIRFLAAQAKMDSLLGLVGMGDNSAPDRVLAFATTLEASEDQRLVQQGRQLARVNRFDDGIPARDFDATIPAAAPQ